MNVSDDLLLHWKSFQSTILGAFKNYRRDGAFTDVTLVCGEGQVQAHKVVLSACSSFFSRILLQNPHPHPLIYLMDVGMENLKLILDFMYFGEIQVSHSGIDSLLETSPREEV